MMLTITKTSDLRTELAMRRRKGQRIGLVPTMGNLHEGHLSLVGHAKQLSDCVVTSIYVNSTQFGPNEDFDSYPRTVDQDKLLLSQSGNDILFLPDTAEIYPSGLPPKISIDIPSISKTLCGASRPHYFGGVALVVSKLFNLVGPDLAFFGEKDYQQLLFVKQLVNELNFPIEIIGVPTVRESNGLAKSSRNQYLSEEEKALAAEIYNTLTSTAAQLKSGAIQIAVESIETHIDACQQNLSNKGFHPEYFKILRQADLVPPGGDDKELVLLIAAKLGKARLIDNLTLHL